MDRRLWPKPLSDVNPADGHQIGTLPCLGTADVQRAVGVADQTLRSWHNHSAADRSNLTRRWFELCMTHQNDMAQILTTEHGKPPAEAHREIADVSAFLQWFSEEAKRANGDVIPGATRDRRITVIKQAVEIMAAIALWSFSNALITRKAAVALTAGCTIVTETSSATPNFALALAALAEQAGILARVVNVLTGKSRGKLAANPTVRKTSLPGFIEIGKLLMLQCAGTVKNIPIELVGNAPFIAFDDAHLDAAVKASWLRSSATPIQPASVPTAPLRSPVFMAHLPKKKAAVQTQKIGNSVTTDVQLGPAIDKPAVEKALENIRFRNMYRMAGTRGGSVETGKRLHFVEILFFDPAIPANVSYNSID